VADEATGRYRFRAWLVLTFAGLALLLAMVGVFGILAAAVQHRTREFGVRMALGASATDVLKAVLTSAAVVVGAGVAIGLTAAVLVSPLLATVLFNIPASDPVTFAAVVLVLIVTAAVATAAPAWRAARIDPVVALRTD
jgi:ABC-type antimicrobial peptide transport system permease subunit